MFFKNRKDYDTKNQETRKLIAAMSDNICLVRQIIYDELKKDNPSLVTISNLNLVVKGMQRCISGWAAILRTITDNNAPEDLESYHQKRFSP